MDLATFQDYNPEKSCFLGIRVVSVAGNERGQRKSSTFAAGDCNKNVPHGEK